MRRGILLFIVALCGCALQNTPSNNDLKDFRLDFTNCNQNELQFLTIKVPGDYKIHKTTEHGFCEYMMTSKKNNSIVYVSSNTITGSSLNYENRLNNKIETYSINRSERDTIKNSGLESDGEFWLEWIMGSYVIGYVNVQDSAFFNSAIDSVILSAD